MSTKHTRMRVHKHTVFIKAISTRSIESRVYHSQQYPSCRVCKGDLEAIYHTVVGFKMQVGTDTLKGTNKCLGECTRTSVPQMD